jgi:Calcineurin-like phosphoesterase
MQAGTEYALALLKQAERHPGVMVAPRHAPASLLMAFLGERASKASGLEETAAGGYEVKFDEHDLKGWIGSFFSWWRGIKKHQWINPTAAQTAPDNLRIAILGDWGTGLYGAPHCAESIVQAVPNYDMVVHLGDVYYAGTPREVQDRFFALWPKVPGALNYALNSNHEMYTGGHAYFGRTLRSFKQGGSTFALQNRNWLLVGLDTAYAEHDLARNQTLWLRRLAASARQADRKIVLFSHHQPYSILEKGGEKLIAKLSSHLDNKEIFAWYWGHEHRCVIYNRHPRWGLMGRCIGHSGFPYFRDQLGGAPTAAKNREGSSWRTLRRKGPAPGAMMLDGANPYVIGEENDYGPNGYAAIEISGAHLSESVYSADGDRLYEKQLC